MKRTAALVGLALLLAGCAAVEDDVSTAAGPIVGGALCPTCAWPSTLLAGDSCTGTLVHPRVVVTAAHCVLQGIMQVSLGESDRSPARVVRTSRCVTHPSYANGETDDVAVCVLSEDVTGVPAVRVMAPCEA